MPTTLKAQFQQQTSQSRQEKELAEQRADQLGTRLQELGIDPEQI